jgi:hypothetical protein
MNVFRGGSNSLNSTYIDFIQFEFGNGMLQTSTSFLDFWEMFHENYYFYLVLNMGLMPIIQYGLDLECSHTGNFLLERKE